MIGDSDIQDQKRFLSPVVESPTFPHSPNSSIGRSKKSHQYQGDDTNPSSRRTKRTGSFDCPFRVRANLLFLPL